jgi:hypothetical protein
VERAATQALPRQASKPGFDPIEPGTGRGRKVQVKARVAAQPTLDMGMLVDGTVSHDPVQVHCCGRLLIDALQEAYEFLMPVLRWAFPRTGGSRLTLNVKPRCGLKPWSFQICRTLASLTPCALAINRVLQGVGDLRALRLMGAQDTRRPSMSKPFYDALS